MLNHRDSCFKIFFRVFNFANALFNIACKGCQRDLFNDGFNPPQRIMCFAEFLNNLFREPRLDMLSDNIGYNIFNRYIKLKRNAPQKLGLLLWKPNQNNAFFICHNSKDSGDIYIFQDIKPRKSRKIGVLLYNRVVKYKKIMKKVKIFFETA